MRDKPLDFIQDVLLPTAKIAKSDNRNGLSVEDDGRIYIETPLYEKFTVNNPSAPSVSDRYFSCNVRTPDYRVTRFCLPFENEEQAKRFKNENFGPGAYLPRMNLDLYKQIVAADAYKSRVLDDLSALSD